MKGREKLHTGDYNNVSYVQNPDGTTTVTVSKTGEKKAYRFTARNLGHSDEEVLEHEVIKLK